MRISMKVLVIGSGAREHAIVAALARSPSRPAVVACPGNAGIARMAATEPIAATDLDGLVSFAEHEGIDLAIAGPEAPLVAGIADRFQDASIPLVGPSRLAALLEGSKAYAKSVMSRFDIPTADHRVFRDPERARAFVRDPPWPLVIKADGLAAGKGVFLPPTPGAAEEIVERLLVRRELGEAGGSIVVEERLDGTEASFHAFCDGTTASPIETARDYKRLSDGDGGPNTGGMGAVSPARHLNVATTRIVEERILRPLVEGLAAVGIPYRGVLYIGLMLTHEGPKVLEFNCRLGDPESQVLLPRLHTDFLEVLQAIADERLADVTLTWDSRPAVGIVMAARGYPGEPARGDPIEGLEDVDDPDVWIFHGGTTRTEDEWLTAGGRVLTVTALGPTVWAARRKAYEAVGRIRFEGAQFRRDIAEGIE